MLCWRGAVKYSNTILYWEYFSINQVELFYVFYSVHFSLLSLHKCEHCLDYCCWC